MIASLQNTCDEMRKHISLARQDTDPVLEEASSLMRQKNEAETKQRLLDAFSKHFLVPEDEVIALTSTAEPVDDRFFSTLSRVKQIHQDCQALLGGESERLGLEIMEQSSKQLSMAYQKLYKWIQKEFKSLNLEDPQINSFIRRALRVLAERPSLFHSCLDFFADAREYILSDAFHYALTEAASGTGAGERNVKPIEFSAHDPLRYVGDMLAWVHSAAVSEREALETLFVSEGDEIARGIQAGIGSEPWSRIDGEEGAPVFDGQKALSDLVNRDLSGVSRSLRQRVELVIRGHDDAVSTYKVANLLSFYRDTFSKLVGSESELVGVIASLVDFTFNHFVTLMQEQVKSVQNDVSGCALPDDLSVPEFLTDALETVTSLMKAYEASIGAENVNTDSGQENPFTRVLRVALDPFVDLARSLVKELEEDKKEDQDVKKSAAIYQTNVLLAVRSTISTHSFAASTHAGPITTDLTNLRTDLLDAQRKFLLETSGLQVLLDALEPFQNKDSKPQDQHHNLADIANIPAFEPENLTAISQQLDDFLPSALMDATENLKQLRNPSLVKSVTEDAVEAFCRDFEFVEGMIFGADEARGIPASSSSVATAAAEEDRFSRYGRDSDIVSVSVRGGIGGRDGDGDGETDGGGEEKHSLRALFPRTVGEIRVLLS